MSEQSTKNSSQSPHSLGKRLLQHVSHWRTDLVDCLAFFSRLPVPPQLGKLSEGMPDFERSSRALPLIGVVLALVALAPATLFDALALTAPLPSFLLAGLTIATMIMITGGMHEDGLADLADGFWGGMTTARKLEIMKDSRLGSYGALALLLSVLLRISILAYLFENYGVHTGGIAYLVTALVSRVPTLHVWYMLPAARLNGLSATAGQPSLISYGIAIGLAAVTTALVIGPVFGFAAALSAFVMVTLASLYIVYLARKHLRGQTGDVLGAAQQLGEIAFGIGLLLFASAG